MNQPSREQIEARITALLLGELPAAEAELLRWTIAQDADLQKLHDELQSTIVLVRETVKPASTTTADKNEMLKLSDERRKKLLAHFKTPRPKPLFWLKPISMPSMSTLMVSAFVILFVIGIAALSIPNFVKARSSSQANAVITNIRQIDAAKQQWALENKKSAGDAPTSDDLKPYLAKGIPKPVMGETYVLGKVSEPVAADVNAGPEEKQFAGLTAKAPSGGEQGRVRLFMGDSSVAENAAVATQVATLAPEPVLAPPPVQIVLPSAEPSAPAAPVTGSLADAGNAGVYSQNAGGYVNVQNRLGLSQRVVTADGNNQSAGVAQPSAAAYSFGGAVGGAGGGGSGGAGTSRLAKWESKSEPEKPRVEPPSASATPGYTLHAQGDSDANRSAAENTPAQFGRGYPLLGPITSGNGKEPSSGNLSEDIPAETSILDYSLGVPVAARPQEKLPAIAANGITDFQAGKSQELFKEKSSDQLSTSGLRDHDGADLESQVNAKPAALDTFTTSGEAAIKKDQEEASKNQPYYDQKRNLEQKLKMHEMLYSKLEAEKLDIDLPKNSMVQQTDLAEPPKKQTFWQKLTGQYESKARMKVENDATDIVGLSGAPDATSYDPYFIQTTFEIIHSDAVLGKVVDALKLDDSWSKKNGGEKLSKKEAIGLLKRRLDLQPVKNTKLIEIGATSDNPEEAAKIANAVADAYKNYRFESRMQLTTNRLKTLVEQYAQQEKEIRLAQAEVGRLGRELNPEQTDVAIRRPAPNAPVPQPEILTRENEFSTFSLNVSDVSFKLAAASLEKGQMPDAASIRSEEFINAFDYRDPEAAAGQPLAFVAERARYPFAHNRDLLRFSIKTAAAGRSAGRALNLVLLLDNSGSMERADRVLIIREALHVLATQLQPQDTVSVVTFARTARLWADGVAGDKVAETLERVGGITPEGGTNLEEAMRLAYETARRHYLASGMNRVVLLTDGAANLGNVDAAVLKEKVEAQRKQGIALDCFGIGWEGFNDDLLEQLSSNGDGRYAFLNSPEDASKEFAAKLAGALQVAASDVKVQVEFNPQRVISYRQIGYAKHQLTKEQFRDNTVDAAEIAAQEAGNALYTVETKPDVTGPVATVRVRYKIPGTTDFRERSWDVPYAGKSVSLEQSSAAMRLAATASAFSEWLASSPFAQEVTPDELLKTLSGVPEIYGADQRPKKLEWMIRQAKSLSGK